MNQDKISKFIKEIRKKNNLTQKELADKYNVTYQAVSKWENGKNLPDKLLLKQMSKDFNVSLDNIFEGEYKPKKQNKIVYILVIILIILSLITLIVLINSKNNSDFKFKTLSTKCSQFNISGSIAYNNSKSAIYINNIKYCGGNDNKQYKKIECTLYEKHQDIDKKISTCNYNKKETTTLEDYLKDVTFAVDNYSRVCKKYSQNNLYLEIHATDSNNLIISYKIPLLLKDKCN